MSKYFEISGYWKDDKVKFNGYIVKEEEDIQDEYEDDSIFYYGLSEEDIKLEIELGWSGTLDFVITDYIEIEI